MLAVLDAQFGSSVTAGITDSHVFFLGQSACSSAYVIEVFAVARA